MSEPPRLIMVQFLSWVADRPRSYAEAMEAWRSTCPHLSVWEDAIIDGLVRLENDGKRAVRLTARGRAVLAKSAEATEKACDPPALVSSVRRPAAAEYRRR